MITGLMIGGGGVQSLSRVHLFRDPVHCSLPGFSVHGISHARILKWAAISFSKGSSRPMDQMLISCLAGRFFTTEQPRKPRLRLIEAYLTRPSSPLASVNGSECGLTPDLTVCG